MILDKRVVGLGDGVFGNSELKRGLSLVESFAIIITLSIGLTFLPNVIFPGWRFAKYFGAILLILCIFSFSFKKFDFTYFRSIKIYLYFLIYVFLSECLFALGNFPTTSFRAIVLVTTHSVFATFLVALLQRNQTSNNLSDSLKLVLRPYFYFVFVIIFISLCTLILSLLDIINPESYPVRSILGYEFNNRLSEIGILSSGLQELSFPLYLSIVGNYSRILPIDFVLLGWSYEPHVATLFATPALLLTPIFVRGALKRSLTYLLFAVFIISAGSMTNLVAVGVCFGVIVLRSVVGLRMSKTFIFLLLGLIVFTIVFSSLVFDILTGVGQLISSKILDPSGESFATSNFYWSNLWNSSSFIGDGFMRVPSLGGAAIDPGIVSSLTIFVIFLGMLFISMLLMFSKDLLQFRLGIVFLYLVIHSYKFPIFVVNYPFYTFFVVIAMFSLRRTSSRHNDSIGV